MSYILNAPFINKRYLVILTKVIISINIIRVVIVVIMIRNRVLPQSSITNRIWKGLYMHLKQRIWINFFLISEIIYRMNFCWIIEMISTQINLLDYNNVLNNITWIIIILQNYLCIPLYCMDTYIWNLDYILGSFNSLVNPGPIWYYEIRRPTNYESRNCNWLIN